MEILEEHFSRFTGVIVPEFGRLKIMPDTLSKYAMDFTNPNKIEIREGDKVMAAISKRGSRHSEHQCEIVKSYGSSLKASVCALSILDTCEVSPVFPAEVIAAAREMPDRIRTADTQGRTDLRGVAIFTIDGPDTKDIDDAVSVRRLEDGYELGVHIADVSHYVTPGSVLDNEAFLRGTSVYYANRVVPMLPQELSNGICSLNPQTERLAFSVLMEIGKNGGLRKYRFFKSVIRSRVQGVYGEINRLLAGEPDAALAEKYAEVLDCLPVMKELAEILKQHRKERGAPELETTESKLIIDENDVCIGVKARERGFSEEMIEDFMLMANRCAAKFGQENQLPFVYRIHEDPPAEKVMNLTTGLTALNVPYQPHEKWAPADLSEILEQVRDTPLRMPVNMLVLRSMAKAKYAVEPIGHFGLVLADYAHFTSPIRRYPDLSIHRIMSAFLGGASTEECEKRFGKFAVASAEQSTRTELNAMTAERSCEDCYKAEYLNFHLGESYPAMITSVMEFGMFAALPDTCEGHIRIEDMPDGEYEYDGMTCLHDSRSGKSYRVGDEIRVKIAAADVSSGRVDFVFDNETSQN